MPATSDFGLDTPSENKFAVAGAQATGCAASSATSSAQVFFTSTQKGQQFAIQTANLRNGKDPVLAAFSGEKTHRAPWVPFVGCHAANLLDVSADQYLKSADLVRDGVQAAVDRYQPDGVPVYLLTGYLGSGKTTMLNHLLSDPQLAEKRIALIVNEFGTLGVDGQLVAAADGRVFELNRGSLFCACIPTDLAHTLQRIAEEVRFCVTVIGWKVNPDELRAAFAWTETN